jgi:ATP-dependent DNA ligase
VGLFTRRGYDWSDRYPRIVEAVSALPAGSATPGSWASNRFRKCLPFTPVQVSSGKSRLSPYAAGYSNPRHTAC